MCRVFGIAYGGVPERLSTQVISIVLFRYFTHGGPHAWGYMRYDGSDVTYHKQPGPATDSCRDVLFDQLAHTETTWFVGHTRWATLGDPDLNQNNHPLWHGNILGVHNGKLVNHEDILAVTGREDETAEVDSEAIFAAVDKWGHEPGLRKIQGDMVAVYTDLRKPRSLHVGRSVNRHLEIGWTVRGNIIFASTRAALVHLEQYYKIHFTGFSSVRDNRHLVIRDGEIVHRATYAPTVEHEAFEFVNANATEPVSESDWEW